MKDMKVLTTLFPKPTHIGTVLCAVADKEYVDEDFSELLYIASEYIRTLEEQVRQFELVTLARQILEDFCEPNELPAPLIKDGDIVWDDFPNTGSKIIISQCRDGYLVEGFGLVVQKRVECLPGKLNDVLLDVINTLRNQKPSLVQRLQQFGECEEVIRGAQHHRNYRLEFSNGSTVSVIYRVSNETLHLQRINMGNVQNQASTIEVHSTEQDEGVLVEMVRTFLGV